MMRNLWVYRWPAQESISVQRWAEVRWHVRQCQHCQEDVEGLCEALELNIREVVAVHNTARKRLLYYIAPAAAAALILGLLGMSGYLPALLDWPVGINEISHVQSPATTPALVDRQQAAEPQTAETLILPPTSSGSDSPTMKVSVPLETDAQAPLLLRVAICSETERPICGEGMELMSVVGAECQVTGDENSCAAKSAVGGCAVCLVSQ